MSQHTGDLADAIARADLKQLRLRLALAMLVGVFVVVIVLERDVHRARINERGEWGFTDGVLRNELAGARRRYNVDPDGQAEESTD